MWNFFIMNKKTIYIHHKRDQQIGGDIAKLAAHELHDLQELTMSCVNSITNMGYMVQHVQDQEFKSILERHFPFSCS